MRVFFLIALLLSACGFEPLYKDAPTTRLSISTPKDKYGYLLKRELEDILYLSDEYALIVGKIRHEKKVATLEENRERTRYDVNVYSDYVLTKNGEEIQKGTASAIASYNVVDSDYNTYIAEQDAIKRGIREMAEEIRGQIIFAK